MNVIKFFIVAVAAVAVFPFGASSHPSPSPSCIVFYALSSNATFGQYNFAGVVNEDIDVPFFYSYSNALSSSAANPDGRVVGKLSWITNFATGLVHFFATDSWISGSAIYKGQYDASVADAASAITGVPGVVTGGIGCFLGITGSITVAPVSLLITAWKICPQELKRCPTQVNNGK